MRSLTKQAREGLALFAAEGARVLDTRHGSNHLIVDYTFDGHHIHTTTLSRRGGSDTKSLRNLRAAIRRNKP